MAGPDSPPHERFAALHRQGSLGHQPGLDGLRGIAVAGIVAFHGGFAVARGAFLSVSLFFTLSGFLITSLLLSQAGRGGRVPLKSFWTRRFRRLLPAAWLTLGCVMLGAVLLREVSASLRGDLWAALAQVANWRFLLAGQSYGELFHAPSPLLHYWSLSIEEQFYLIYPPLLWVMLRITGGRRSVVGLVLALAAAVSFLLPVVAGLSLDRTYYGTDTRAGEFLAGAVLGVALCSGRLRMALIGGRLRRQGLALGGVAALGATVWLWATTSLSSPLLTAGGLALVAALSSMLVLTAMVPGPLNRLATLAPLRWLGRISYGVYLFHWPALLWLRQDRVGLNNLPRVALVTGGVLALAAVSERFFERPIRRNSPGAARAVPWVAPLALCVLVLGPVGMSPSTDPTRQVFAGLERAAEALERSPAAQAASRATGAQHEAVPTYMAFGDSILLSLVMSVAHWRRDDPPLRFGGGVLKLGCGIVREGTLITSQGQPVRSECREWPTSWPGAVATAPPDFAVLLSCQWEALDRRMPGEQRWLHVGQPELDALIFREYLAAADTLHRAGVPLVIWATCPHFSRKVGVKGLTAGFLQGRDPARIDRLNEIVHRVAAERREWLRVMEWGEWMEGRVDVAELRRDGSHFAWKNDTGVGQEFGSRLLAIWRQWRSQRAGAAR